MVKETAYYDFLGVSPTASKNEIKRGFKRMALKYHPDRNPKLLDKFNQIVKVYKVLSDSRKRVLYDRVGARGLRQGHCGEKGRHSSTTDDYENPLLGNMCGNTIVHNLKVSLLELYHGGMRKLSFNKRIICDICKGSGIRPGGIRLCTSCDGKGSETPHLKGLNSDTSTIRNLCNECFGVGMHIAFADRCHNCLGWMVVEQKKTMYVHIDKGMKSNHKSVLYGEGNQFPSMPAGDVIVMISQKEHPVFKRSGNDLIMTLEIGLEEALCSFKRVIQTIDGRELLITSHAGEVVKPGDVMCIAKEGMPLHRDPLEKGDLFVYFKIRFPESGWLPVSNLKQLEALLPPRLPETTIPEDAEEVELSDLKPQEKSKTQPRREAYEEDRDDEYNWLPEQYKTS